MAAAEARAVWQADPYCHTEFIKHALFELLAPLLLLGSEYGHIVTFKRLCALGFFIGFTSPKLYSLYSNQICKKGEGLKVQILEAWRGCSHKKLVAGSAITAFWNLTSIKTSIFAGSIHKFGDLSML